MIKPVQEYLTATHKYFGDGEYWLFLPLKSAIDLEHRFGWSLPDGRRQSKSLAAIYGALLGSLYEVDGKLQLLESGEIFPHELNEIVRQALIGGNSGPDLGEGTDVGPQRADGLVKLYGYPERPVEEIAAIALHVLHAAWRGDPAQREALPEQAAASDQRAAKLDKQIAEQLGPTMRARAEQGASG